jgi:xylulokinase
MALLGIDVGTTTLKAGLYDEDGGALALVAHEYGRPGEGAVLRPDDLWAGLAAVTGKALAAAPGATVRAVAVSSHGESVVPLDELRRPLAPFIANTDCRGVAEAQSFARRFGREVLFERTGLPVHPMYTLVKIAHLKASEPALFAKARAFRCVEDWILERAGVGAFISTSLASRTLGLDLGHGGWGADLAGHAGIGVEALAMPVPAGTPLGRASAAAAAELGLPPDALWVAGGHDQGCCSLGAGGYAEGTAVDGTGTFECISLPVAQPLLTPQALACNFPTECHTVAGRYLTLVYLPGGIVLKWFRDALSAAQVARAGETGADPYDVMLTGLPEEPTGLTVFPHLIGTGTPWLDSEAQGAILGITAATTYAEMVKAVLEGITCEMQWNLLLQRGIGVGLERIHAVGGGTRSPAWLQMKADVFGLPVTVVPGEASCAGAAMCAGIGLGLFRDAREAGAAFVRTGSVFEPRPAQHARYAEKVEKHRALAARLYGFAADPGHPGH